MNRISQLQAALGIALGTISAVLAWFTPALTGGDAGGQPYYTRSAFFPWVALGLVIVFGAWTAGQAIRGTPREESDEIEADNTSVRIAIGGMVLLAAYIVLSMAVGYALATFLALGSLGLWAGLPRRVSLLLALITTAVLYGIFVWGFKVWFAPGWVQGWLS